MSNVFFSKSIQFISTLVLIFELDRCSKQKNTHTTSNEYNICFFFLYSICFIYIFCSLCFVLFLFLLFFVFCFCIYKTQRFFEVVMRKRVQARSVLESEWRKSEDMSADEPPTVRGITHIFIYKTTHRRTVWFAYVYLFLCTIVWKQYRHAMYMMNKHAIRRRLCVRYKCILVLVCTECAVRRWHVCIAAGELDSHWHSLCNIWIWT